MALKQYGLHVVLCSKQGNKIEGVVLLQGVYFRNFFPNQGQGFKPSVTHLYPNIGRVPSPGDEVVASSPFQAPILSGPLN